MFLYFFKKYVLLNVIKFSKILLILAALSVFIVFLVMVTWGLIALPGVIKI